MLPLGNLLDYGLSAQLVNVYIREQMNLMEPVEMYVRTYESTITPSYCRNRFRWISHDFDAQRKNMSRQWGRNNNILTHWESY